MTPERPDDLPGQTYLFDLLPALPKGSDQAEDSDCDRPGSMDGPPEAPKLPLSPSD